MSFEEEFAELAAWYRQKIQEYFEAFEREKPRGLDSLAGAQHSEDRREYNRRLVLLKVKHGKELNEDGKAIYDHIKDQPLESE